MKRFIAANDFIRIHHHHLINMNHVSRFLKIDGGLCHYERQYTIGKFVVKDAFLERLNAV